MITYSNSPCRERDAHSLGRCSTAHHYRFRAFPRANRTQGTASTRGHSATSSTSEPPSFVPSLRWQCSVAGAWLGVDSGVASPHYNVRRPVLPPPTRNAKSHVRRICFCGPQAVKDTVENRAADCRLSLVIRHRQFQFRALAVVQKKVLASGENGSIATICLPKAIESSSVNINTYETLLIQDRNVF